MTRDFDFTLIDAAYPLLDRTLTLHAAGLRMLEGVRLDEDWHGVVLALMTRSFNSMHVARAAVRDGFPIQAVILARAVYEDVQTAEYVYNDPTKVKYWMDSKYAHWPAAGEVPSIATMQKATAGGTMTPELRALYHWLSQLGHPKVTSVGAEIAIDPTGVAHFALGARSVSGQTLYALYCLLVTGGNALGKIVAAFVGSRDPVWRADFDAIRSEISAWAESLGDDVVGGSDIASREQLEG